MEPLRVDDPKQVGRYRLVGRLGVGGMGRVYAARGPDGGRAAVKVIRDDLADDTEFRHRFRREVAAASAVAGIFTARVLDADPGADPPWLATEFVEGPSLRDAVLTSGPCPNTRSSTSPGLAEALAAIHAAGLVHRDLKPANVLLSPAGPRVIDFGIARAVDSSRLTATGQIIGTPDFMAPEQIEGLRESGPEADVFALGSTLAWAATGRGPFAADQAAATLFLIISMPPDLRGVPPRAAEIVEACLAKDAARRPSAVQLAVWLRGSPSGPNMPAGATTVAQPLKPPAPLPQAPAAPQTRPRARRGRARGCGARGRGDGSGPALVGPALVGPALSGRRRLAAAQPLTVDAYSARVNSYLDGTRSLALAATLVKGIKLPATYTAASSVAPHCTAT